MGTSDSMPDLADVCIWAPRCPPNYVAVGSVATKDCTQPELGDAYCVLASLAEKINKWESIWDLKARTAAGYIKRRVRKSLKVLI